MHTRVYRYGLTRPPKPVADAVRETMRQAARYYNALIEAHRDAWAAKMAARGARYPRFAEVEAAETEAVESLKDGGKPARERLRAIRAELKAMRAEARQDAALLAEWDAIDAARLERCKALRAACGIYWGTYILVEAAVDAAVKATKGPPRFRRWDGGGRIGVQLQGGLSVSDALACGDTRLRIDIDGNVLGLSLRIGSVGRDPVWQEFFGHYSRQLPDHATIKTAAVVIRRHGRREAWHATITCTSDTPFRAPERPAERAVGIDVGWRRVTGGLRVAVWRGSDGRTGELVLSERWLDGWQRLEFEEGERSRRFNEIRDALKDWLAEHEAPEWLVARLENLGQWKSIDRLWRGVCNPAAQAREDGEPIDWRNGRFDGDCVAFNELLDWWRWERDACDCAAGLRRRLLAQRREIYTLFAVGLRRRYAVAKIEALDGAALARRPEKATPETDAIRKHRFRAAVGELLELVRYHMDGCVLVPPQNTTRQCHACGRLTEIDGAEIMQTCGQCGSTWDQDANAAWNLLHASGDVVPNEITEITENPDEYAGGSRRFRRKPKPEAAKG